MRGLIVVLFRAGLRIQEALDLVEGDLDPRRGALLVRSGTPLAAAESHREVSSPPSAFPRRDTGRAMAQENVELVREIITAVPDWHEVSALLHPDARFDQTRIPDGGVYEGREACGRFFERWFGTWDEIRLTPERFIEDGDRVLALMTIEGRGKGSGVPVVIRSADLFTIRDGKIASLVGYPDRAEALADTGLSG